MEKLTVLFLLCAALALTACGEKEGEEDAARQETAKEENAAEESGEQPSETGASAGTAEPGKAQLREPAMVSEEDASWVRELYDALMMDDFDIVKSAMENEADLLTKCTPYELEGWPVWDYETAYQLKLSDAECVGVIVFRAGEDASAVSELDVFVGTADGQNGFEYLGTGDKGVTMFRYSDGVESEWQAFDGQTLYLNYGVDDTAMTIEDGDVWTVWHA